MAGQTEDPAIDNRIDYSIVIPIYNEAESLKELIQRIEEALAPLGDFHEILCIDDGSDDRSLAVLKEICGQSGNVKAIELRRNYGKATALDIGFRMAAGGRVVTMDADLQDDPADIPSLAGKLDEGYDLVSGWKKVRRDPLRKRLPSKLFNFVTARFTGLKLHDFNCGFKAYRKEVVKNISLYGEMHRYIPALAFWKGFKVTEIPVRHHPRKHGKSKYGVERFLKGLFDFMTIAFITKYTTRPMHFFGMIGLIMSLLGFLAGAYLTVLWFMRELWGYDTGPIGTRPLLMLSLLLLIVGTLFFSTGLLGEMLIHLTRRGDARIEGHLIKNIHQGKPEERTQ